MGYLYLILYSVYYSEPCQISLDVNASILKKHLRLHPPIFFCSYIILEHFFLAANAAFVLLVAGDMGIESGRTLEFATKQINYMLGDGGRSYVCGFGNNPPQRPHHKAR